MNPFDRLMLLVWGYMIHAGTDMFHQDLLGLEGYIAYMRIAWVDLHWGWGLAATVLCMWGGWNYKVGRTQQG